MSMTAMVNDLASQGRNGDTLLAHITVEEAQLLKDRGGSGTINPDTGIMEFGILSDLWNGFKSVVRTVAPIIIPAVAIFVPTLIPAIGTALGASAATASVIGAAALSAGVTLASGGSLKDVLTSAALAGASTYLTPIVGKALTPTGASTLTQIMAGSAAVGAGYTALRGGSVKEMMAAAATGAASAYLGNLAKDSVAKMNNLMASNKVTGTITQKGATDATFVAADAANLKAAGLSQSEISKVLVSTGVSGTTADYAATAITNGMEASTLAANLASGHTNGIYSGEANTKAIIAGNNPETMQRIEDAKFLAADAAQLKAQGLDYAAIKQNLMASGVDANMANLAAQKVIQGYDANKLSSEIVNTQNYLTSGKVYTNTTDTIARNLGEAMTPEQVKEYKALPFKELVNNGSMTIDEASVLGQNGVTPQQANDLIKLGYTASDLDNLIGAGVKIDTLTNLANTKFPESQINGMLQSGVSANDISIASGFVNNGKLSLQNADSILKGGLTGYEISNAALSGKANSIADLFSKGMTDDTYRKLSSSGMDFNAINNGVNSGKLSANDLNWQTENNPNGYKTYINNQVAGTPVQPTTQPTVSMDASDANVLKANGYTTTQIQQLTTAGYTPAELADLASTGIKADQLITLSNGPFTESVINDLLSSGKTVSDLSSASNAVKFNGISTDTAAKLLDYGYTGSQVQGMAVDKVADGVSKLLDAGVNKDAVQKYWTYNSQNSVANIAKGLEDGRLTVDQLNQLATKNTINLDVKAALAKPVPAPVSPTAQPTTPVSVDPISDLAKSITQGSYADPNIVQGFLDKGYSVQQISNAIANNPNGGFGAELLAQTPGIQPVQPPTNLTASYTPEQEALYNQYRAQGMTPAQATQMIEGNVVSDTGGMKIDISGSPVYSDSPGSGLKGPIPQGFELAPSTDLSGAEYRADINAYIRPTTVTPYVPVITPNIDFSKWNVTTPVKPAVTPQPVTPTVTPPAPVVTPPQPTTPTVVSSTTRVTNDGSVYRDDKNSDGTVTSVLISGPTSTGGTGGGTTSTTPAPTIPAPTPPTTEIPEITVTAPREPVVTPPVDNTIPSNVDPGGSYDADIPETPTEPYIPIVTPPTTPAIPVDNTHYGTYKWGTPPAIKVPEGLNPGFITNVPDFYQPTNQAGSKFYWGAHPFQPGPTFDPQLYNQVPNAPVNPFGLGYAQRAATSQDILSRMQATQPVIPR